MSPAPGPTTATWRKSSYSGGSGDDCVEVSAGLSGPAPALARAPVRVRVRDSKNPTRGELRVGAAAWSWFVGAAGRTR